MSFSHAAVLNISNVSRECQVKRKTCEGYLEILEDLLLGFRLEVFSKRAQRELAAHPKLFFFDTGVFRANRPTGPLDAPEGIDGAALEGLVARHLRAWCDYSNGTHTLSYWQTRSKVAAQPGGFEDFFREVAAAWGDMEAFVRINENYRLDMDFDSVPELCQRFGLTFPKILESLGIRRKAPCFNPRYDRPLSAPVKLLRGAANGDDRSG